MLWHKHCEDNFLSWYCDGWEGDSWYKIFLKLCNLCASRQYVGFVRHDILPNKDSCQWIWRGIILQCNWKWRQRINSQFGLDFLVGDGWGLWGWGRLVRSLGIFQKVLLSRILRQMLAIFMITEGTCIALCVCVCLNRSPEPRSLTKLWGGGVTSLSQWLLNPYILLFIVM